MCCICICIPMYVCKTNILLAIFLAILEDFALASPYLVSAHTLLYLVSAGLSSLSSGSSRMKGGSMTKVLLDTVCLLGLAKVLEAPVADLLMHGGKRKDQHAPSKPIKVGSEQLSANAMPPASKAPTVMVVDKKEEGEDVRSQPRSVTEADAMDILLVFQSVMTITYRYKLPYNKGLNV